MMFCLQVEDRVPNLIQISNAFSEIKLAEGHTQYSHTIHFLHLEQIESVGT